jgi:signal transduction histidine kinase
LALNRLDRLSDANALLFSLHRVAQTLPASLDLSEVLDTTVARLRGLVDFDAVAVLVFDDTDSAWQVIRREGSALPNRLGPTELPPPLMTAMTENRLVEVSDFGQPNVGPGISPMSSSGLYTVLPARGAIIGLLAVESRRPGAFSTRDIELLNGFVEPVALAIDNARWFSRLRTVGADEERTRIARDLHDNIGQSLAYLAFELDRIVDRDEPDDVKPALDQLRHDLRGVIGEVRDTLYDLRTDVSEGTEIGAVLEQFASRLAQRTELDIRVYCDQGGARLPILQEREMWRIAQEALVNVERHAKAKAAAVRWRCDGEAAALEVADDGQGFPAGKAGRLDSYGMMGMRERASSIGATLEIHTEEGRGTVVRCFLPADRNAARRI